VRNSIAKSILGVTAVAFLISACSSTSQGTPSPTSTTGSTSSGTSSSNGAPHVQTPLDTSRFQSASCTLITAPQVQSLNINTQGVDLSSSLGPGCNWIDKDAGSSIAVQFVTSNKQGLSSIYAQKGTLQLFQEIPSVQGYPAVLYAAFDGRKQGACSLAVGVSDSLDYSVVVQFADGPNRGDPCPVAVNVANMVMTNLKG
jgi:Protein of unknown function (DUF3558)